MPRIRRIRVDLVPAVTRVLHAVISLTVVQISAGYLDSIVAEELPSGNCRTVSTSRAWGTARTTLDIIAADASAPDGVAFLDDYPTRRGGELAHDAMRASSASTASLAVMAGTVLSRSTFTVPRSANAAWRKTQRAQQPGANSNT